MNTLYDQATPKMDKIVDHLVHELLSIRTGRANAAILDSVSVSVYGSTMTLSSVASISVQDAKTLMVSVWDASNVKAVDNAIRMSDLGLNPRVDGNNLFLMLPELTEERRQEYVKIVKKKTEESKVQIRNVRRDVNDSYKGLEKNGEMSEDELSLWLDKIQKLTDEKISKIDKISESKQKDLLSI